MSTRQTSKFEKNKFLDQTLKALNYHDEREAAIDLTILSVSARYAEFSEECQRFEKKYGMEYGEFEKKISNKVNDEDFGEEDDLMAWKFAKEGAGFWHKKLEELNSVL